MTPHDPINHPPHYVATPIEPIDVIEAWGLNFHTGNVVKYLARAPHKGTPLEDLRKALWYLKRAVAREEELAAQAADAKRQAEVDRSLKTAMLKEGSR